MKKNQIKNLNKDILYSLVIPVYKNADSLEIILNQVKKINKNLNNKLEVLFIVDGSPDLSEEFLMQNLTNTTIKSKLIVLSRNFGSFSAIIAGIKIASGEYFAVMAADLQDPPEIIIKFFKILSKKKTDIILGVRSSREDPLLTKLFSNIFWSFYRKFVQKEMPKGGVDIFGFNKKFRDQLITLDEKNTSLVGLIFWLGFKRSFIKYKRLKRRFGKSSWTFEKKYNYFLDSIFSFSELPIRFIQAIGAIGLVFSISVGSLVLIAKTFGQINVPGYTATVLLIMFFGFLNILSISIVAGYVYRAYENTKNRPKYVVLKTTDYNI